MVPAGKISESRIQNHQFVSDVGGQNQEFRIMRPPREFCPKISESRIQNPKLPAGLRIMGQNPESRVMSEPLMILRWVGENSEFRIQNQQESSVWGEKSGQNPELGVLER